jgi:hypothetical protein
MSSTMKRHMEDTAVAVRHTPDMVHIRYDCGSYTLEFQCEPDKYTPATRQYLDETFASTYAARANKRARGDLTS